MPDSKKNPLTREARKIFETLGITDRELSSKPRLTLATHTREPRDAAERVKRELGIQDSEFQRAHVARMQREGGDHAELVEKLGDLARHIGLANMHHIKRTGKPSISLLCASQLARELKAHFGGPPSNEPLSEGEPPKAPGGKVFTED